MRSIKKIVKIHQIQDYNVTCLFNNGESRVIDFKSLFKKWRIKKLDSANAKSSLLFKWIIL